MTKIIALSGKKQAGKNTACNHICGTILKKYNVISYFLIDELGNLIVPTMIDNEIKDGVLDLMRKDREFVKHAEKIIWPTIKVYSFADELKSFCIRCFGLSHEQCYGTNEQKSSLTDIIWEKMPGFAAYKAQLKAKKQESPTGRMTAREILQYFGTNVVRKICSDAWVNATIAKIKEDEPKYALICDARFPNEILAINNYGGHTIRLLRHVCKDDIHESEIALDGYNGFSHIIDNNNLSIQETNTIVSDLLKDWGW